MHMHAMWYASVRVSRRPRCSPSSIVRFHALSTHRSPSLYLPKYTPHTSNAASQEKPTSPIRGSSLGENQVKSFRNTVGYPRVGRQISFFIVVSIGLFGAAAYYTNKSADRWHDMIINRKKLEPSFILNMAEERELAHWKALVDLVDSLRTGSSFLSIAPISVQLRVVELIQAYHWIIHPMAGTQYPLAISLVMWGAWKIRRLQPFMRSHFTHNPLSGRSYTLLTSVLSHASYYHFWLNFAIILGVGRLVSKGMTSESLAASVPPAASTEMQFLAFFCSAGMFSLLASHIASSRIFYPQILAHLTQGFRMSKRKVGFNLAEYVSRLFTPPTAAPPFSPLNYVGASFKHVPSVTSAATAASERQILPYFGASGATYAVVVFSALCMPDDIPVYMLFGYVPGFLFKCGVGTMVAVDCICVWRHWRVFDHYAHLGGAAFGLAYYMYGGKAWDILRGRMYRLTRTT